MKWKIEYFSLHWIFQKNIYEICFYYHKETGKKHNRNWPPLFWFTCGGRGGFDFFGILHLFMLGFDARYLVALKRFPGYRKLQSKKLIIKEFSICNKMHNIFG